MDPLQKPMGCDEAQGLVMDLDRDGALDSLQRASAIAHLAACPQCAALQESWQAAKSELLVLNKETSEARAPARVEMRLRQEFRARRGAVRTRHATAMAAWALAAAAVLVGSVSVWKWQEAPSRNTAGDASARNAGQSQRTSGIPGEESSMGLAAEEPSAEFTPLPGTISDEPEEGAIWRVRMQRSSLGALGLPVNEQRAGEWIQVDLLVGTDGLPQAVRLAEEE